MQWPRRMAVFFYCGLIFYLSSQRMPDDMPGFDHMDLLIHFLIYGVLALLALRMFLIEKSEYVKKNAFFFSFVFTVLYGISDELHQKFVPSRHMSLLDLAADALGAFLVLLLMRKTVWYRQTLNRGEVK
jgi:VanZ family protein